MKQGVRKYVMHRELGETNRQQKSALDRAKKYW